MKLALASKHGLDALLLIILHGVQTMLLMKQLRIAMDWTMTATEQLMRDAHALMGRQEHAEAMSENAGRELRHAH
jgi:hypothetical protein